MNTTKKTIMALLLVLIFTVVMAVALAAPKDSNATVVEPVKAEKIAAKTEVNQTFSACMKDAVAIKQTNYDAAKETRKTCLDAATASNTSDAKKIAGKNCSSEFKTSMKTAKGVFTDARNECKKIKHTALEGFTSYFQ